MSNYTLIKNICYADRQERGCYDIYLPENKSVEKMPMLIYFYGGSLKKGSKDDQLLPAALAEKGIAVAVPDYRLYPNVNYPDFINDAADATSVILKMANNGNFKQIDTSKIFIGGHSAGAYLSMMLCFDRRYLPKRGLEPDSFAGYLFISGQPTKHFTLLEAEELDPKRIIIDDTAALYHVTPHGSPLLIVTSDLDLGCRKAQNILLHDHLKHIEYDSKITFCNLGQVKHGKMCRPDESGNIPVLQTVFNFISEN